MTAKASAESIRAKSEYEFLARAEEITNSDPVLRIFAACEWECLNDDGKLWVAAIVRETLARAAEQ